MVQGEVAGAAVQAVLSTVAAAARAGTTDTVGVATNTDVAIKVALGTRQHCAPSHHMNPSGASSTLYRSNAPKNLLHADPRYGRSASGKGTFGLATLRQHTLSLYCLSTTSSTGDPGGPDLYASVLGGAIVPCPWPGGVTHVHALTPRPSSRSQLRSNMKTWKLWNGC